MSYRVVYAPAALQEYKEALFWYTDRSDQAAENFVAEVKSAVAAICKKPLRHRNTYKDFRETSLKKISVFHSLLS